MAKNYHSIYGQHIKQLIQLKRNLGFRYVTETFAFSRIDELAITTNQSSKGITKPFADLVAKRRQNESKEYHYHRVLMLAKLSSYMNDMGIASYIPKLPPCPKNNVVPYIYTKEEIDALLKACDELRLRVRNHNTTLFCMPVLVRVLYATGIRIGEALDLKDDDINLENKYIRVNDSKNGKQRIIPIAESLVQACSDYLEYRNRLPSIRPCYFFCNLEGNKCNQGVRSWFRKCLELAGIPYMGRGQGPRIHDLRHTFAVRSLAKMADTGMDLYVSLPILSNYLGHQSIESTNHYVRLTASIFPDLINDMDRSCIDVFPKFSCYETD